MFCAYCGVGLPPNVATCPGCGRATAGSVATMAGGTLSGPSMSAGGDVTMIGSSGGPTSMTPAATPLAAMQPQGTGPTMGSGSQQGAAAVSALGVGTAFGNRYHIIRLLGVGGMGAVYQAWDDALGVAVALKIIRPEITADPAAARDLERRFKRELLLARQVTHKNVVRIHDLGEIDGIKYLTMPYIQGSDLATLLSHEKKLPVPRAIAIARQVVSGLQAAHEAGVVHRDLKPANVMIDADEQAVIMDFGIARSVSGGGATMAGAVVGTLEYMAPEQAMAQPVDHRADIYALGLMLYDMVLGPRYSSRAESAVAELMSRVQKPLPPARSIDATIPEPLERVIDRCTQPDPGARYQATAQLARDLEVIDPAAGHGAGTAAISAPPITRPLEQVVPPAPARAVPLKAVLAGVALLTVVAGGWLLWDGVFSRNPASSSGAPAVVSLGIIPFRNASGDRELEWLGAALADMLRTEVGQSSSLRAVPSDRVFQILQDLRINVSEPLDAATIRRVADFSKAEMLIAGQYIKLGTQIRIDATIHDNRREQPVPLTVTAANEGALIGAIGDLSRLIRENLALAPGVIKETAATSFRPSSSSVPALRQYTEGLSLVRQGQHLEAVKKLEGAIKEDKTFALAHARLGQTLETLGYEAEARRASQEALDLSSNLPAAERYLISGMHARIVKDPATAIDAYQKLLGILPDNDDAMFDLAGVYHQTGELDKARDLFQRILQRDPNHMAALLSLGRVEIKRGQSEAGLESLNKAQSLAITVGNDEGKATVFYALGIAYRTLNRLEDALRFSEQGLEIRRRLDQKSGIAESLLEIARTQQALGKLDLAAGSYQESLELRKATGDKAGIGDTLLDLGNLYVERGQYERALQHYMESLQVQREVGNQNYEALLLSNIGGISFMLGNYDEALTNYQRSLTIRERLGVPGDIADTLHNLAEAYERRGRYDQALDRYLKALELRRTAGDKSKAALDRYSMGTVFERQGRLGAALASRKEALDTYKELGERGSWLAEMLSGYASALIQVGRGDEALPLLDEAAGVARNLENDLRLAETFVYRGDLAYYAGNTGGAKQQFETALALAGKTDDPHILLIARLHFARVSIAEGRGQPILAALQEIEKKAEALGLPYLVAESRLLQGRARLHARQFAEARTVLEQAARQSEELGLRLVLAQSHHALAQLFKATKEEPQAAGHASKASQLLEEIRKEAQPADVLKRADLREIAGR